MEMVPLNKYQRRLNQSRESNKGIIVNEAHEKQDELKEIPLVIRHWIFGITTLVCIYPNFI